MSGLEPNLDLHLLSLNGQYSLHDIFVVLLLFSVACGKYSSSPLVPYFWSVTLYFKPQTLTGGLSGPTRLMGLCNATLAPDFGL